MRDHDDLAVASEPTSTVYGGVFHYPSTGSEHGISDSATEIHALVLSRDAAILNATPQSEGTIDPATHGSMRTPGAQL